MRKLLDGVGWCLLICLGVSSCKSVEKSQQSKTESTTVKKSDSSSVKTYTVIDTTKTDSSIEINETTVQIDSIEYDYVPSGDLYRTDNLMNFGVTTTNDLMTTGGYLTIPTRAKAKGVKVVTKVIKQAAIVSKGQTTASTEAQNNTKVDSAHTETVKEKITVKKPQPFKTALTVLFIVVGVGGLVMIYVAYKKKRNQVEGVITGMI